MARSLNPAGFGARPRLRQVPRAGEAPSDYLSTIGRADGPERPIVVQFSGISEAQQRAAIAAFPGGKRFILRTPEAAGRLLRQS